MFGKNLVFYITQSKLCVFDNVYGQKALEIAWDKDNPLGALLEVGKRYKGIRAKVVVGEDLSYVSCIDISGEVDDKKIIAKASEIIPEELTPQNFTWKVVDAKLGRVQLTVIPQSLLTNFSYASKKANIKIDSITPAALLLGLETENIKYPHVIVYTGIETIAAVAHKGSVLFSTKVTEDLTEKVQFLLEYVFEKFNIKPAGVVYNVDKEVEFPSKWEKVKRNLNPMAAAKKKKVTKSEDTHEEIVPTPEPTAPEPAPEAKPAEPSPVSIALPPREELEEPEAEEEHSDKIVISKKVFFAGIIVVLLLAAAGGFLFLQSKNGEPTPSAPPEVTSPAETPEPTEAPEKIDLKEYKLQVLNGAGVAGVAQVVSQELVEAGFEDIATGNADNYDYQGIDIETKKGLPDAAVEGITEKLKEDYDVSVSATYLEDSSEYDVVIIVGKS